ncbi:GDP-mannose 4,6-dehydratase [Paenibacillus sp. WC2504]|uniref:GDP-mannose 4,6-dehydratase n=1 Tax=Paenibacillus sp. WC2504 TaxID=3461403 RepID=UPI0040466D23
MRVLITGSGGFVGSHLTQKLLDEGHEVIAGSTVLTEKNSKYNLKKVYLNVNDKESIEEVLRKYNPEGIINLAAQSSVAKSWEIPEETLLVNVLGTLNIINSMCKNTPYAKFINIGSSEEYGLTAKNGEYLTEIMPCLPQNPYATSKLSAGQLALQSAKKHGLNIVHVRAFNHFGPGQRLGFVVSDFASQIVNIEKGKSPSVINVGDLSAQRDFLYIKDLVNAYTLLLESKKLDLGIVNVCSGVPRKIEDILKYMITQSKREITVNLDSTKLRPSDVPFFVGSNGKIKETLEWESTVEFNDGLELTIEWWRQNLLYEKG